MQGKAGPHNLLQALHNKYIKQEYRIVYSPKKKFDYPTGNFRKITVAYRVRLIAVSPPLNLFFYT